MTKKDNTKTLQTIGRTERADIPEWELFDLKAKIDTGAYTSSLHCHHIEQKEKDGRTMVCFNLLDPSHEIYNEKLFEWPVHKSKKVKSSNGVSEERIIVKTTLRLAGRAFNAELSLTDRSEMRHPLLIGRKFLKKRFLVDVNRKLE
jgi:hypothetical protein